MQPVDKLLRELSAKKMIAVRNLNSLQIAEVSSWELKNEFDILKVKIKEN